ncbi:hypothetical protein AMECASPLE_014942 [Ameca splendens]|uniref:CKLF-like MARVEL transmembrane domain-containing protein 8 n=1 Tax=Ameca splendens TaxID=208324 RepID=A0ABV0Y1Y7_9TELE
MTTTNVVSSANIPGREQHFLCCSNSLGKSSQFLCIMDRTAVVPTRRGSSLPQFNTSTSTLAFDQHFTTNAKGILLLAEISLCFNCSAAALYLVTAVVDVITVNQAIRGRHNYNCWAASAFFAFLATLCYAGSGYLSYRLWKTKEEEQ